MEQTAGVLLGAIIGWAIGLMSLYFFDDEIFAGLDRLRSAVRRLLRLEERGD